MIPHCKPFSRKRQQNSGIGIEQYVLIAFIDYRTHFLHPSKIVTMKLAIAFLLVGSAAAFAPTASVGVRNSAVRMSTEAVTEKVRKEQHVRTRNSIMSDFSLFGLNSYQFELVCCDIFTAT